MKSRILTRMVCGATLFVLLAFVCSLARAEPHDKRIALIIGNGTYENVPLPNALNDARAMADTLKAVGFNVSLMLDGNQAAIQRAIIDFGKELEKGDIGLFYYTGHAIQMGQRNYMIPIGAHISVEEHVEPEGVDMLRVVGRMAGARTRMNIIILDACRKNPFWKSFRFYADGLAQTRAPARSFIAYAAGPGEIGAEGGAGGSYYTEALVRYLREPGLTIEEIFKKVRAQVMEATSHFQVPWTQSSITESFYFTPPTPIARSRSRMFTPGPSIDHEIVFWQSIYNENRPEDFEAYLDQFPYGLFATLARERLKELRLESNGGREEQAGMPQSGARFAPKLFAKIDKAMDEAKAAGATHDEQIASASEKLHEIQKQRAQDKKRKEELRQAAVDEEKRKVQDEYKSMLVAARGDAETVERRIIADAEQRADAAAQEEVQRAAEEAQRAAMKDVVNARRTVDAATKAALVANEKEAETIRQNAIAAVRSAAEQTHRATMAKAEEEAEKARQQILALARTKADQEMAQAVAEAERKAEKLKKAQLAILRRNVERDAAKMLEFALKRAKEREAKAVVIAKDKAEKLRNEMMAKARHEAMVESEQQFTAAMKRAAHLMRQRLLEIASRARDTQSDDAPKPGPSRSISPVQTHPPSVMRSDLARNSPQRATTRSLSADRAEGSVFNAPPRVEGTIDPELQDVVEEAMAQARRQGATYQDQLRAALEAVKRVKGIEGKSRKTQKLDAFGMTIDRKELKLAVDTAIAEARAHGQDYEGLARAALGTIKSYRKENTERSVTSQQ